MQLTLNLCGNRWHCRLLRYSAWAWREIFVMENFHTLAQNL